MAEIYSDRPLPQNADELGLSEGSFGAGQAELEKKNSAHAGGEREKNSSGYVIFATEAEQHKALALIGEYRQHDEAFSYLRNWHADPVRPHRGLTLEFSKTSQDEVIKLRDFFARNGLAIAEYYSSQEQPAPHVSETPLVSRDNIIELPAKKHGKIPEAPLNKAA